LDDSRLKRYAKRTSSATETSPLLAHNAVHTLSTIHSLSTYGAQKCAETADFDYIVDNTMLTNYHTLHYVASTLRPALVGGVILEAFTQEKDRLVLRFDSTEDVLIISCEKALNACWLRRNFARARANSANVLGPAVGRRVTNIAMHPVDRVVMFTLDSGCRLDACFFGAKANVFVVDARGRVLDAFKSARQIVGTHVEYRSGELVYDIDMLRSRLAATPSGSLVALMKETFPTLGATLVKEVLHRASLPSDLAAGNTTEGHLLAIQEALASLLTHLATPAARVYVHEGESDEDAPMVFSLVPLFHLSGWKEKSFGDVHEAIRFFVASYGARTAIEEHKQALATKLMHTIHKAQRTVEALEREVHEAARADEYQRFGDLLMSNLHRVHRGDEKLDLQEEGVSIPLQKSLSPVQNAQRYYEKAKRARTAHQQATARLAALREKLATARRLAELLDNVSTREEMNTFMADHRDELERVGIGKSSEKREQLPFRVFIVDGGFEVWAGKSSKNNDELTLKHAKPTDLWFHARGASGSHVVLKVNSGKGEPTKKAKEQAAAIAAYYSKMRNAKMVPVAMTEKKYVRKPKGAAPGSVIVEREKIIFAEPALPTGE
jgi:predicted ribosome quality control (RQC) complex YloA/Tae2 family protein